MNINKGSRVAARVGLATESSFCAVALAAGAMMMVGIACNRCVAANISWAAPQKIVGDPDVRLTGVLVRAINATPTNTTLAIDVTLNGVTFVAARKNGSGSFVAPGGDTFQPSDTSSVGPTSGGFQAFGQGGAPFSTLSAAYSNLLCTAYWNDGTDIGNTWAATAGYDWTLNNLTVGRTYELQVWVNDSRVSNLGQNNPGLFTSVMDTNGNSVNLEHNVDNILGGVGQYVIGTFTADATSQALKLIGGNTIGADTSGSTATSLLNAYQLRDITPVGAPHFTGVTHSGTEVVLIGTNGPPNGAYEILRSTNVSAAVGDWPGVGTGSFAPNGNFSFTNPVSPTDATVFYRLLVVSDVPVFPPVITSPPQDLAVSVGQNANFNVTATGTAPLTYQWYFNTNAALVGQTNSVLTLTNAQLTNAGQYSVTVTNLYGSTNSVFATLTVNTNSVSELVGWAAVAGSGLTTTTGGGNATPILATNLAHLRSLAGDGTPRVIHLSGTYTTGATPVEIASNKTLRGTNNAIIQGGININTRSNIIVQNLTIQANGAGGVPVDAAAARTSHHLWFDHLSISDAGDGNLDLTVGSDYITVSWCKFFYTDPNNTHRLCSLVGNGSTSTTDTNKNNVTFHHNWFSTLVDQRMPRLLFGKGHFFNNYYYSPGNSYCIGTGSWGTALIENNYFKQVNSPHQFQDTNPSYIALSGNIYDNCTGNQHVGLGYPLNDGNDPGPWSPPYPYTLDAGADVPGIVTLGAGPQ